MIFLGYFLSGVMTMGACFLVGGFNVSAVVAGFLLILARACAGHARNADAS